MATSRKKPVKSKKSNIISSKKKFSFSAGQRSLLMIASVIALVGVGYFGYNAFRNYQAQATAFQYVGTHPQASLETTNKAQQITALVSWNGKIYSGYGDWEKNTGPMSDTPFDPATGKFASAPEFTSETEALEIFSVIDEKLYAIHVDPRGGWGATYSVADKSTGTPVWQNVAGKIPYTHAFGITKGANPNELFIAGQSDEGSATNEVAKVYRSTDGGQTWSESLSIPSRGGFNRMMFIAKLGNKIYAQNMSMSDFNGAGSETAAWSFDGTRWSSINPIPAMRAYKGTEFAGKIILKSYPTGGSLLAYDGGRNTTTLRSSVRDYTVGDDGYVYSLGYETNSSRLLVSRSKDLSSWENITYAPSGSMSIAYLNNSLYVGTSDSKLYRAEINVNSIDSTPPSIALNSPTNGATIGPLYTLLAATASDSAGISKVEYYAGSYLVATSQSTDWLMHSDGLTNPYTGSYGAKWNGLRVPAGTYSFKAIAYDTYGNSNSTAPITITVPEGLTPPDTQAPVVTVTSPTADTRNIRRSITLKGSATDNAALSYMEIMLDGRVVASQTSASGTIASPNISIAKGAHTVIITAKDAAGNTSQSSRSFSSK